jgi:hypothetical protein
MAENAPGMPLAAGASIDAVSAAVDGQSHRKTDKFGPHQEIPDEQRKQAQ